jgi:methionine synthase / methylenetetrahydrofolate reductase(NADPH)
MMYFIFRIFRERGAVKMGLLERLQTTVLTADGAIGTLLYNYGLNHCHEEMNISRPEVIENIHKQYIEAGADVIQTNTYGANKIKLARYGLEEHVAAYNEAAVAHAKRAAQGHEVYVLGTIGGVRGLKGTSNTIEEIVEALTEQAKVLIASNVDGLLLETFYDLDELKEVLQVIRPLTTRPIIAQVSMQEAGVLQGGIAFKDALEQLAALGADIVGTNCNLGPFHTIQSFEQVSIIDGVYLSAYPNASLLDLSEGKVVYESEIDYYARSAEQLVKQGVRLIGGCCGTTPKHIEAVKKRIQHLTPVEEKEVTKTKVVEIQESEGPKYEPLHIKAKRERSVIVELDTPRHLETEKFLDGAKQLYEKGADIIMMADNSLASPRVSNIAMAALLAQQGIRALPHITCRDRNLIGLQSHLMGLDALDLHDILIVTGDPTKVGDFPGATSVYDVSSMELMKLVKQMNEGISFSGKPLQKQATFSVAGAFNPNVRVVERAVDRLYKKIEHGCDYFISQPVYTVEKIREIYEATKDLDAPIYIGIMPVTSFKSAEFLHHEVPGIKLSDDVLARMKACGDDKQRAADEGVAIAKELLDVACELFNGIYLITPFLRYDMTLQLMDYVKELDEAKKGAKTNA